MLTNTHYATSLLPPFSSSPLAQPKTTDKRFFLNGFRLTTPQAKLEEKKAEKETKRQWRRVEHALLLRCSAGAMIILGSDKYLESEFEQLISTKSNKNKNNAQKGKRPIMPSFKALSETCTKDNWQKLMARRRQQRQTTDRQNDSWNKKKERQLECHTQMQHSLTYTHTHTRALLPLVYIYIYLHTPLCTHIHVHIHTHICRLNILLLCLHNRRRRHRHREHVQQQACWRSRCCRCRRSLPAGVWARKRYDAAPNSTASFFARTFIPPWCKRDNARFSKHFT